MTVQRYRPKPQPPRNDEGLTVARYDAPLTGDGLADLLSVARLNDDLAEVAEVAFPSGKRVLLARGVRRFDEYPSKPDYVTVEPGEYLTCGGDWENLHSTGDAELARWYEPEERAEVKHPDIP
jgi:hypothetical protein